MSAHIDLSASFPAVNPWLQATQDLTPMYSSNSPLSLHLSLCTPCFSFLLYHLICLMLDSLHTLTRSPLFPLLSFCFNYGTEVFSCLHLWLICPFSFHCSWLQVLYIRALADIKCSNRWKINLELFLSLRVKCRLRQPLRWHRCLCILAWHPHFVFVTFLFPKGEYSLLFMNIYLQNYFPFLTDM